MGEICSIFQLQQTQYQELTCLDVQIYNKTGYYSNDTTQISRKQRYNGWYEH